jgi:hypothetical protein
MREYRLHLPSVAGRRVTERETTDVVENGSEVLRKSAMKSWSKATKPGLMADELWYKRYSQYLHSFLSFGDLIRDSSNSMIYGGLTEWTTGGAEARCRG